MSGELKVKIEAGDMDGFILTDGDGDRCYVYFSEVDELIEKLRSVKV